jgi:hypothetical protein
LSQFSLLRRTVGFLFLLLLIWTIIDWQNQSEKIANTSPSFELHYSLLDLSVIVMIGIVQSIALIFCFLPDLFFQSNPRWYSDNERLYWEKSSTLIYQLRLATIAFYYTSLCIVCSLPIVLLMLKFNLLILLMMVSVITYLIYFLLSRIVFVLAKKYRFKFDYENDRPF